MLNSMQASYGGVEDGTAKFTELGNAVEQMGEDFVKEYLEKAGIAYHEGSDIYPLIHEAVEQALGKFRAGVDQLKNESSNLSQAGELTRENDNNNKRMMETHISDNSSSNRISGMTK